MFQNGKMIDNIQVWLVVSAEQHGPFIPVAFDSVISTRESIKVLYFPVVTGLDEVRGVMACIKPLNTRSTLHR